MFHLSLSRKAADQIKPIDSVEIFRNLPGVTDEGSKMNAQLNVSVAASGWLSIMAESLGSLQLTVVQIVVHYNRGGADRED